MENEIKRNTETLCNQPEENRLADEQLEEASGGAVPAWSEWRCKHCGHLNDLNSKTCEKCGRKP